MTPGADTIHTDLNRAVDAIRGVRDMEVERIASMADTVAAAIHGGGKVLLCGNGGSAAHAQHLAAEFLVRLRPSLNRRGLPAVALAADAASLTACGNDYGFDRVFARMVEALGRRGDVLVALSTSGDSRNVVAAVETARGCGIATIGLLGGSGGSLLAACDLALVVPSSEPGHVQEAQIAVGHALVHAVEEDLLAAGLLQAETR